MIYNTDKQSFLSVSVNVHSFFFMTYFSNKINPDFMVCGISNINYEGIYIISVDPNPLGISTKLQKATVSFMISVCPPFIWPSAWNNSAPTGQNFMKVDIQLFFKNLLRKFKFH